MTFSRAAFENRIRKVLNYNGKQDIVFAAISGIRRREVYNAEWVLACACMSPEEYIAFGNKGGPWMFLRSRQDGNEIAERAIECLRRIVEKQCAEIGYEACNWESLNE